MLISALYARCAHLVRRGRLKWMLAGLITLMLTPAYANDSDTLDTDWKQVKNVNNIQVFMKHTDQSRMKTFRGETIIDTDQPLSIIAVLLDFDNSDKWLYLSQLTELERLSDQHRILQVNTHLPWPLRDRAAIADAIMEQDPDTLEWVATLTETAHPASDALEQDYVMLPEFEIEMRVTPLEDARVKVLFTAVLDPGGYIPAWMANIVLADLPFYSLERIRRSIDKPEYRDTRFDFITYP